MKLFTNIVYSIAEENYELAIAALSDVDLLGITEGLDELTICLDGDQGERFYRDIIEQALATLQVENTFVRTEVVAEENWNEQWEAGLEPIVLSERVTIVPNEQALQQHMQDNSLSDEHIVLYIKPKMSFGTGHHETTTMMAQLLEDSVRKDSYWIDAGTGTGLLAFLTIALGAEKAWGFDNDIWSVENARENCERNSAEQSVKITEEDVFTVELGECDGICANLHRNILEDIFPKMYKALKSNKGILLISGILRYDREEMQKAAQKAGFTHQQTVEMGEWLAMKFFA
jgi:ribosomal protein L11 methyltransferase